MFISSIVFQCGYTGSVSTPEQQLIPRNRLDCNVSGYWLAFASLTCLVISLSGCFIASLSRQGVWLFGKAVGEETSQAADQHPKEIDRGTLTPSLAQRVKFPGWKMHARPFKQFTCRSYSTSTFSACVLMKILSQAGAKKKAKSFKVSNLVLLLVVFKWHPGSDGVNAVCGYIFNSSSFPFTRGLLRHLLL